MSGRLLAVSPHLDDAIFSAGGTLARRAREGWRMTVATCFTGNVARPQGFALACQLDKGLGPEVDYMAVRRAEDRVACAAVGAEAVHLPFLEAPHRGYDSAPALFGARRPDDDVEAALSAALDMLIADHAPDLIVAPLGIGGHVDHLVVLSAVRGLSGGRDVLLWEDWPYRDRATIDVSEAELVVLAPADITRKIAGCRAYQSQLGFQFGSAANMERRLRMIAVERFYQLKLVDAPAPLD